MRWSGSAQHGASIVGGMHHAMAAYASGFCVYNDVAIAIAWLLDQGAERIAYVDIDAQRAAHAAVHALAHDLAGGRWLLTGGGGYDLVRVVPQTWTHLLVEAAGSPIDPVTPTPAPWRDYVARRTGVTAPEQMTEGEPAVFQPFESGYDPGHPVDRAIMATRNAVFPFHGLTPL
jgi:acetoin utilization protein AcuC